MGVNHRPNLEHGDHRRATADRNVESILDAVERLLEQGSPATIAAVATEAGTSRVTVYAHFPAREQLLEAALERAVRRATTVVEAAAPDVGPPAEALDRLVAAGWQVLERFAGMAAATMESIPHDRHHQLHQPGMVPVYRLIERGRREGAFREDLPAEWLVACAYALFHAAAAEVRAGRLDVDAALGTLTLSLRDLFVGCPTSASSRRGSPGDFDRAQHSFG
jgi:AcrR family transcriptional regulator